MVQEIAAAGELSCGQVGERFDLAQPTVSHHLKILHESGVLASDKLCKEVWFWINRESLENTFTNVLDYLREHS